MLAWLLVIALLAACSGGTSDGGEIGGGGGGTPGGSGGNTPPPDPNPDPTPTPVPSVEAMIEWAAASGPVAGYHVFVSRNSGAFTLEGDATQPRTTVVGVAGEVIQVQVAAFDAFGNSGPPSQPSDPLVFTSTTTASSSGSSSSDAGATSSSSGAGAGASGSGSTGGGSTVAGGGSSSTGSGASGTSGSGTGATSNPSDPPATHVRADLDGDGAADLVWQSADGTLVRVTSADMTRARLYTLPAGSWHLAALGDFDGDGSSDLLFAAPGELAIARGSALAAGPGALTLEPWAHLSDGAELVATGDFDADGGSDALVSDASGLSLWLAAGDVRTLPALPEGAHVAGVGDADGDGHSDLVLADDSGRTLWRVVAGAFAGSSAIAPAEGELVAIADLDGDGADELALRSAPDALTLERGVAPFDTRQESAPAGATLVGCRDYDGDGVRDRLWQDAGSLHVVTASGEQQVPLDPESPWRLLSDCK